MFTVAFRGECPYGKYQTWQLVNAVNETRIKYHRLESYLLNSINLMAKLQENTT